MKTIFIIISRGFIVRNILRSGVLDRLARTGQRIVIFLCNAERKPVPEYILKEFARPNIFLHTVADPPRKRFFGAIYRNFCNLSAKLVYTRSTWVYMLVGNLKNMSRRKFWAYLERFFYSILGKFTVLKRIVRWIDFYLFTADQASYRKYFDDYKPDLVFSTSNISKIDIAFMKEARRRNIRTVSMTKGWDYMAKLLFRFVPDLLIVQNENLKRGAVSLQGIPENRVAVTGFPQFDWYAKTDILMSREDFFSWLGLDPARRLLFFGSEGLWTPRDDTIVRDIIDMMKRGDLACPSSLLIRPHYSDLRNNRFEKFAREPNVKLDFNITRSDFFQDTWDPGLEETKYFINAIYHCDMMITVASTLVLDAACLDKPAIGVGYGAIINPHTGEDLTDLYYQMAHFQEVVETGGVEIARSKEELLSAINVYLSHPGHKARERQILRDKLCYKVDGNSAYRVFKVIEQVLVGGNKKL